jgi:hypothetical protein
MSTSLSRTTFVTFGYEPFAYTSNDHELSALLAASASRIWRRVQSYDVEVHALGYPELTGALRRPQAGDRDSLAVAADELAIDPVDVVEALAMAALATELGEADDSVIGRLRYEGLLYVRPVGRGVVLDETGDELDEAVERAVEQAIGRHVSGDFVRGRVLVEVLADEGSGVWPREPLDG